jgi:hypothetical protein
VRENRTDIFLLQSLRRGERVIHFFSGHESRNGFSHKPVLRGVVA